MADQQLTPLAMAALGLLAERSMHPYEMYQTLMQRHEDRLLKIRPGTLYHAVGRLESAGLVVAAGRERDGNRPERTTYAILPAGRELLSAGLRALLAQPVREYPRFPQALSEAHNLPAADVAALLESRVAALESDLAALAAERRGAERRGVPEQFWIDVGYQERLLQAELEWVGELSTRLRSGAMAWGI